MNIFDSQDLLQCLRVEIGLWPEQKVCNDSSCILSPAAGRVQVRNASENRLESLTHLKRLNLCDEANTAAGSRASHPSMTLPL